MNILSEFGNKNSNYKDRPTVKAVIVDETTNRILTHGGLLVGGGIEERESDEQALHREALEEAGAKVEIGKLIGTALQYRDFIQKKYITNGYFCRYISKISDPTTTDPEEQIEILQWEDPREAIERLKLEISSILKEQVKETDRYQERLYNRQIALTFLEAVYK